MLKKTITSTDFDGNTSTDVYHFHLSKAELIEMEMGSKGGFANELKELVAADNGAEIIAAFKRIIMKSYGELSADGKRFSKSEQISSDFANTDAYSELFMELATDADAAALFINGLVPASLQQAQVPGLSASEQARAASAANMQGFNKPAIKDAVVTGITVTNEGVGMGSVEPAVAPVEPVVEQPTNMDALAGLSTEELQVYMQQREMLRNQPPAQQ